MREHWRLLGALVLCTVVFAVADHAEEPPVRVAIQVDCGVVAACDLARTLALDEWSHAVAPGQPIDLVVDARDLDLLDEASVAYQIIVPDIDAVARAEAARLRDPTAARPTDWFGEYRDFRAISDHLRSLAELAPTRASLHAIGGSVESRPLWALRIAGAPGGTPMLVNGTQHAREWISAMVTTCVADRLVRDYDRDPEIRAFVDRTELWIIPVVNPDGYQHSWSTDRYWRKNRRDRHGVDLNRNFGVAWGGVGSSNRKGSEIYRGPHAFSEPETIALRSLAMRERFALHLDFHAYSQLVIYPWNHTSTPPPDRARLAAVGDHLASAMFAPHQTRYALITGTELYPASGTMTDWMYGEAGATSYTIELRPKAGRGGFVLPPEQIRPTCDEGLAAVLALERASRTTAPR